MERAYLARLRKAATLIEAGMWGQALRHLEAAAFDMEVQKHPETRRIKMHIETVRELEAARQQRSARTGD